MHAESVALAVDFGGTKVEAALVDAGGSIEPGSRHRAPTGHAAASRQLEASVASVVERALDGLGDRALAGVGIGSAGPVSLARGTVSPLNVPAWREYPLRALLERLVPGAPVALRIDGEAIALAEHWVGAARGARDVLGMVVSTGVGGGLMLGGRTVAGADGNAGHIGHVAVGGADVRCACGGLGCVEAVASGPNTVEWARDQGWRGSTGEALGRAARAGDPIAIRAVRRSAHAIGRALASTAALTGIELVVVGGGFSRVAPDYIDLVREPLAEHRWSFVRDLRVVPAALGDEAPLIGAGGFVFRAELLG